MPKRENASARNVNLLECNPFLCGLLRAWELLDPQEMIEVLLDLTHGTPIITFINW